MASPASLPAVALPVKARGGRRENVNAPPPETVEGAPIFLAGGAAGDDTGM